MSAYNFRTIIVKGDGIRKEGKLCSDSNDITPGQFVERTGENFDTVKHAAAGALARCIAEEAEVWGTDIDTDYDTDGERVIYRACHSGMEAFCLLATGQSVDAGDTLEVAAGGNLTAYAAAERVAIAMESVDNAAGTTPARILVEIL